MHRVGRSRISRENLPRNVFVCHVTIAVNALPIAPHHHHCRRYAMDNFFLTVSGEARELKKNPSKPEIINKLNSIFMTTTRHSKVALIVNGKTLLGRCVCV